MDFKGLDAQYIKKYHIEFVITVFLGLIWFFYRAFLALYNSGIDATLLPVMTYSWAVIALIFILMFADTAGKKNIITEIGENLNIHIDETGISIEDTFKGEKVNRTFKWTEIEVIAVNKRKTLFSLKHQFKVFYVITDKSQYEELLNQYKEGTIVTRKRKEMLNCHFVFQHNPEVMQYIEEHWGKVEE
jgi:hypothetical protein